MVIGYNLSFYYWVASLFIWTNSMVPVEADNSILKIPNFVGWFWNELDEKELHRIETDFLERILAVKDLRNQLYNCTKSNDLMQYWIKQSKRLHVTAMFLGKRTAKSRKYLKRVYKMFNTSNTAVVTGFLLTPRTYSGHVELPVNTRCMFDPSKQEDLNPFDPVGGNCHHNIYKILFTEPVRTLAINHWMSLLQDLFTLLPHVTVRLAPHISPVVSGEDQVPIQKMIKEKKIPKQQFSLDWGLVQDWGNCQFYAALKKPLVYSLQFLPKY